MDREDDEGRVLLGLVVMVLMGMMLKVREAFVSLMRRRGWIGE